MKHYTSLTNLVCNDTFIEPQNSKLRIQQVDLKYNFRVEFIVIGKIWTNVLFCPGCDSDIELLNDWIVFPLVLMSDWSLHQGPQNMGEQQLVQAKC